MESALQTAGPRPGSLSSAAQMPLSKKLTLAAGVMALAAIIAASVMWSRTPDYKVLFANLGDRDGGAVIAALSQMNVPYRFAEGGGAILVPGNQVHDARLRLASQGLPKGGTVGYELMESQRFGVTQFQERLNFQRGLEGELARSIQSLAAVQSARVHLALPAQSGFLRDQQKPSASVLLQLHPGRLLDRSQIAGIVHLVASSVPELPLKQVSVIDQNGSLLSMQESAANSGLDPAQIGYVRQIEANFMQRIVDIVEPIVGRGNVRAQVTADVDFTQSESTAEEYRPNQGRDAQSTVRSQQVSEGSSRDAAGGPQGVPGALSNQPPPAASAPINGLAQALQPAAGANGAAGASGGAAAAPSNTRRDAVTNYEVDKTVKVTRNATGSIRRLTAAVVLNHRKVTDPKGKVSMVALSEKEIEAITALVKEAIGVSKDRGDSVNVMNAAFTQEDAPRPIELPVWKDPENISLAKDVGKHLGLVLLGLFTIFAVIRPALKSIPRPPAKAAPSLSETVANDVALPAPATDANQNADVLKLARDNPAITANVVSNWVGTNG
jgi:flagellar M-ring protein FliF